MKMRRSVISERQREMALDNGRIETSGESDDQGDGLSLNGIRKEITQLKRKDIWNSRPSILTVDKHAPPPQM
jgi:hypothetical protein